MHISIPVSKIGNGNETLCQVLKLKYFYVDKYNTGKYEFLPNCEFSLLKRNIFVFVLLRSFS